MSDINRNGTANMPFSTLNYPTLLAQSRTLMTAPSGGAVRGVIQRLHELMKAVPNANEMMMTSILYESYSLLRSDACAALVSGVENEKLNIAIHASEVLEELRDGTACVVPTGENCELSIVPVELHHRWWEGPGSEEDAEGLVFETLETVMHQAKNFPLAMEVTQSLVTYTLAVALESLPREDYPRQETARTIKLAKYAVPWARYHSVGYICCLREEVFLLDGDIDEVAAHAARAKEMYENTDYVICAEHPVYGVFELGCWMCGFEDFLYRMAVDEEWVHRFFERVLEYQKKVIEKYYTAVGPYIHYTSSGDDFATQNGPFISPDMFRRLIKPYLKERIAYTKRFTKARYLHHSCGSVFRLIDDLVDCGVEILNPIQPKAADMQPRKLKETFGEKIVFHGGIDTQELLPFASEEQIEETVHETIEILNRNGGYIFAAAHNIQPDVNPHSLTVMLNAARKYCKA